MCVAQRKRRLGGFAGVLGAVVLAAVFVVLTIFERSFLRESGWSPIHRTDVAWPSILETGPHGWAMQVGLVLGGILGVLCGLCVFAGFRSRGVVVGASAFVVMSVAVVSMALPPDPPGTTVHSWHDLAHNTIYPAIPLLALVAASAFSVGFWVVSERAASVASAVFVVVAVGAVPLSFIDEVAQLARFVLFGALLAWVVAVGWSIQVSARVRDAR
jgi:hypothetical protein